MLQNSGSSKIAVFFLALILVLFVLDKTGWKIPLSITNTTVSSELSVVGEGKVDVVPDTLYVDLGVTVQREQTAEAVQTKLTEQNNKIIAAIKSLGLKDNEIKTSNYSVNPNYVYDLGRQNTDGYTGNATITVKTNQTELGGEIIEQATSAGATNIGGTRFAVDSPEKYREQARSAAIANAKDQAQKLAQSLGITLGKITNVVEQSPNVPSPLYYERAVAFGGADTKSATPELQAGSQTISSTVTLYFEKR